MKKVISLFLALVMIMALGTTAFAQTVGTAAEGTGSITVSNASKGVTYSVVKLFDASVTGNADGSIVYTGDIPEELEAYFEVTTDGNTQVEHIIVKDAAKAENGSLNEAAATALKTWAEKQTVVDGKTSAVSDGTVLTFVGLEYGYYVVLTSQGAGAVSVTSTNPTGTVYDKNSTEPNIEKKVNGKDSDTVTIGDTVTYTATFIAPNQLGEGKDSEIVYKYEIKDTLPSFLDDVVITSVVIDQPTADDVNLTEEDLDETFADGFGSDKKITVSWAEGDPYVSKYENGSKIIVTYTAKVVSDNSIVVDGTRGNVNTVTVTAYTDDDDPEVPWDEPWEDSAKILTYAAAFRKVDQSGKNLTGAEFTVNGLIVDEIGQGLYEVVSYDSTSTTPGTTLKTDDNGYIVIEGLDDDEALSVIETKAPDGYNKLTTPVIVHPIVVGAEVTSVSGRVYYNAEGVMVDSEAASSYSKIETATHATVLANADSYKIVNQKGAELPETGGMGTTLIYVLGSVMVLGAAVLLITKKRMA